MENPPAATRGQDPNTTSPSLTVESLGTTDKLELRTHSGATVETHSTAEEQPQLAQEGAQIHRGQVRIAYLLADAAKDHLLHVYGLGWHHWDGTCWQEDRTGHAKRAVLHVLAWCYKNSADDADMRQDVRKCETAAGIQLILKNEYGLTVNSNNEYTRQ